MVDGPDGAGLEDEEAGRPASPRPRRRSRKSTGPEPLVTTEIGNQVANEVRRKLVEMVNAAALIEAHQRRATSIDSRDYERGFDLIASTSPARRIINIVGDVGGAIGTGLIGYAVNVYTGESSNKLPGHIAFFSGAALALGGIVLKYVVPGR